MWAFVRETCPNTVGQPAPPAVPCSKARGRWILAATILGSSMAFIDGTVVNVALPALQTHLKATATDLQWVVEAYALLLSAFLLVGGSLGDHYGRRRVFVIGVALFALASAACGMATNIRQLILARGFQGLGGALLVPGSLAIISNSFSEEERGRAIGTWSGLSAMATALGPVLGGWLIEQVSWRAVFFINLPLALIVILISLRNVRETSNRPRGGIDLLGASLIALALGALVYALIDSSRLGLGNPFIVTILIAAFALILIFILVEAQRANPMLPLNLFRSPHFTGANLLTFFLYAALGGTLFFLPLNLIQVQRYSATAAGGALLPFILTISLVSRWSGGLIHRYGSQLPLILGPLIVASGYLLFTLPGIGGNYWRYFFPPVVLLGLGMAITIPPLTTMVMNSVPQDRAGLASGVNNTVARTAGLVAVAVLGIVMLRVFSTSVDRRLLEWNVPNSAAEWLQTQYLKLAAINPPQDMTLETTQLIRRVVNESFIYGFRVVMLIGAGLAGVSAITSAIFIRQSSSKQAAK